jgi:PEP-CTERM motif
VCLIRPKISIPVLIAAAALVISQPSSATTFALDVTTMKGVTQIGSVTTIQVGKDVKVTITLDSGYLLPTDDGYVMFNTTGGLKLTKTSLDGFSVSNMSDKLSHVTTIGGFTFTNVFRIDTDEGHHKAEHSSSGHDKHDRAADKDDDRDKAKAAHHHDRDRDKEEQILLSSLTFTILNANVNQLSGFGLQFCVADESRCGKTGFAETSVSTAPEPGTLALLGTGLVGLATLVRRRSSGKTKSNG